MSDGDTPKEAIPITGASTREAVDAHETDHINAKYGQSSWSVAGRSRLYENDLTLERVDVDLAQGDSVEVYFDISAVKLDDDTVRGVWDDNDQKPPR